VEAAFGLLECTTGRYDRSRDRLADDPTARGISAEALNFTPKMREVVQSFAFIKAVLVFEGCFRW
jgi:hypothetical protein